MVLGCVQVFDVNNSTGVPTTVLLGHAPIDPTSASDCASANAANWLLKNSQPKTKLLVTTRSTFSTQVAGYLDVTVVEFDSIESAQKAEKAINEQKLGSSISQTAIVLYG